MHPSFDLMYSIQIIYHADRQTDRQTDRLLERFVWNLHNLSLEPGKLFFFCCYNHVWIAMVTDAKNRLDGKYLPADSFYSLAFNYTLLLELRLTQSLTHRHTRTHSNSHAHTHTHTDLHTYTVKLSQTDIPTHTHMRAHTHTHLRACMHTHTHTHTHIYRNQCQTHSLGSLQQMSQGALEWFPVRVIWLRGSLWCLYTHFSTTVRTKASLTHCNWHRFICHTPMGAWLLSSAKLDPARS